MKNRSLFWFNSLKCLGYVLVFSLFMYLSGKALLKYLSEPISTTFFKTIGDDGKTMHYPKISICSRNPVQDFKLEYCANGKNSYGEGILQCSLQGPP